MAAVIYLDTHVAVWLYEGRVELISPRLRGLLEDEAPLLSPIVALELEYLFETGRMSTQA